MEVVRSQPCYQMAIWLNTWEQQWDNNHSNNDDSDDDNSNKVNPVIIQSQVITNFMGAINQPKIVVFFTCVSHITT